MAIDTAAKRYSALNHGNPWRGVFPLPDGAIGAQDRAQVVWLYNGISFAAPSDTTPDAFSFVDQTDVALSAVITSAAIVISGIDTATDISITGGEYSINAAAYTSAPGVGAVVNGDSITVRHTSSGSSSTATNTVLTVGGVSDTFTSTTIAAAVVDTGGGGWAMVEYFDRQRRERKRKEQEQEEAEEALQSEIDRSIAQLLHKQEQEDDKRQELERIKSLVAQYADTTDVGSDRVNLAIQEAKAKQTRASLEKLQREFERMMEEEEMVVMITLAMLD